MNCAKAALGFLFVVCVSSQGILEDLGPNGPPPNCVDKREHCVHWTKYCATNNWVQRACVKSCTGCTPPEPETPTEEVSVELDTESQTVEGNSLLDEEGNPRKTFSRALKLENPDAAVPERVCKDVDGQCKEWVSAKAILCTRNDYIARNCKETCGYCGDLPRHYNIRFLPADLQPVAFLIGRWRSEFGGKAIFPTIPKFTYGEQLDFSIAGPPMFGARSLNYSAVAWGINNREELHSEYGFISVRNHTNDVALTTVMNNGFTTVEEGQVNGNEFRVRLQDIGRISFSRDLPVHDLVRTWRLLDENTLEATLEMETLTHPLQEHTRIVFKKIYP